MTCKECQIAKSKANKQNPNSFNHGVSCDACRKADINAKLENLRTAWRELKARLDQVDRSTRSGASLAKDLEARMNRITSDAKSLTPYQ